MDRKGVFLLVIIALMISNSLLLIQFKRHSRKFRNDMNTHMPDDLVRFSKYFDRKDQYHTQNLCDFYSEGVNIHNYHNLQDDQCQLLASSCQIHSCLAAIDIVVLWINLDEKNVQSLYNSTYQSIENSTDYSIDAILPRRFRDFNQLKYMLRSIEKNGNQWIRRIFLVTNHQVPSFLNTHHPRIRLVNHNQLFNYANVTPPQYPLFNSIAIQSLVHSIPTLSSPFYLFDDDIFIGKNLSISMTIDGNKSIVDLDKTRHDIHLKPQSNYEAHLHSTIALVLKKKSPDLLRENNKYAIAVHGPILLYREIGTKVWEQFPQEMNLLLSHPFRMSTDPSIQTLYIYVGYSDYYTFVQDRGFLYFDMLADSNFRLIQEQMQELLVNKESYFVCINDDLPFLDKHIRKRIEDTYELIFPKVSSFENQS